jgi:hypothetical protein
MRLRLDASGALRDCAPSAPSGAFGRPLTLLKRASSSLRGHIALAEIFVGLPLGVLFIYQNYMQGTLTFQWALWCVFLGAAAGLIWAVIFWYTLSLPLLKKYRGSSGDKRSNNRWRGP